MQDLSEALRDESLSRDAICSMDRLIYTCVDTNKTIAVHHIVEVLQGAGFSICMNKDVNASFQEKFQKTTFEVYSIVTVYETKSLVKLLEKSPHVGVFIPMTVLFYQEKKQDRLSMATLSTTGLAKLMKLEEDVKTLETFGKKLDRVLSTFARKVSVGNQATLGDEACLRRYQLSIKEPNLVNNLALFEAKLQNKLFENGFNIVDSNDLNLHFKASNSELYDFYQVYSICKLELLYQLSQKYPDIGVFAPCSLYVYQRKGEAQLHVGFSSVQNWISLFSIVNVEEQHILLDAEEEIERMLKDLGER